MKSFAVLLTSLALWAGGLTESAAAQPGDTYRRGANRPWNANDSTMVRRWLTIGLNGPPPAPGISAAWAGAAAGNSVHVDTVRFGGHEVDPPCDADHARMLIYNSTEQRLKYCTGTQWRLTAVDQDLDGLTLELDGDDAVPFSAGTAGGADVLAARTFYTGPGMTPATGLISPTNPGNLASVDADFTAANLRNGVGILGLTGTWPSAGNPLPGGTADATASGAQILAAYEAWTEAGAIVDGTMPNQGSPTYITPTPSTSTVSVGLSSGYHAGGTCQAPGDADLTPGNVRNGVGLFTVTGAWPSASYPLPGGTADATAGGGQVLAGYEAWTEAGAIVDGTMPNVGAQTITPATSNQAISAGYHNGSGYCAGDADLVAANVRANVGLFGVTGTYGLCHNAPGKIVFATYNAYNGNLGGVGGANAICQNEAQTFYFPGTYKAFLSSSTVSARDQVADAVYYKPTGSYAGGCTWTVVAYGKADLCDAWIESPLNSSPGRTSATAGAWTGGYGGADGGCSQYSSSLTCSNWESTGGSGMRGQNQSTNQNWAGDGGGAVCTTAQTLYCFQQ